jgi:CDP-diacylglycerol---glycerol-3-phosphate 3-phosphatidyltransferase
MSPILRNLPNVITASRLFFASGFLLLLALAKKSTEAGPDVPHGTQMQLVWGFVLFVIAGLTDIIDGPLARRWKVTSSFGRRFDPFVDKVLIGGGFILLAIYDYQVSGIAWWMVAIILAREAFVTYIRHVSEQQGKAFAATWAGKLKMFLQSFAIGTVIIFMAYHQDKTWAIVFRVIAIWTAVIFTAFSALIYVPRMKQIRFSKKGPEKTA